MSDQTQQTPANILSQPLELPCGAVLKNRILKSAMSEILASNTHAATPALETLYGTWAKGGTGLLVTGNVMIDRRALGEPGNVVVEDDRDIDALKAWAEAGKQEDTHIWMQINHPGKQSPGFLSKEPVAPSAVGFGPALSSAFATPRALTEAEIEDLIERFGNTAKIAKDAGFTGVQIHGAHGYLVSQFLSPHHNIREDKWGGSLENRARFVMEIYQNMRQKVGPAFPISIKLNSADFQKGGFSQEDSVAVMKKLALAGIDLIEVSGGTYEAPAMSGFKKKSTTKREGYFIEFIEQARQAIDIPLCVTGGFRTAGGMAGAIGENAADLVGIARALAIQPDYSNKLLAGEQPKDFVKDLSTGVKSIDRMIILNITWYENQIARIGRGKAPNPTMGAWMSAFLTIMRTGWKSFRTRRARSK